MSSWGDGGGSVFSSRSETRLTCEPSVPLATSPFVNTSVSSTMLVRCLLSSPLETRASSIPSVEVTLSFAVTELSSENPGLSQDSPALPSREVMYVFLVLALRLLKVARDPDRDVSALSASAFFHMRAGRSTRSARSLPTTQKKRKRKKPCKELR